MKARHKLTGQILTIKKDFGSALSCYIPEPYYMKNTNTLIDVCVCRRENLQFENEQLKLKLL